MWWRVRVIKRVIVRLEQGLNRESYSVQQSNDKGLGKSGVVNFDYKRHNDSRNTELDHTSLTH